MSCWSDVSLMTGFVQRMFEATLVQLFNTLVRMRSSVAAIADV